jgi:hypothetical protein
MRCASNAHSQPPAHSWRQTRALAPTRRCQPAGRNTMGLASLPESRRPRHGKWSLGSFRPAEGTASAGPRPPSQIRTGLCLAQVVRTAAWRATLQFAWSPPPGVVPLLDFRSGAGEILDGCAALARPLAHLHRLPGLVGSAPIATASSGPARSRTRRAPGPGHWLALWPGGAPCGQRARFKSAAKAREAVATLLENQSRFPGVKVRNSVFWQSFLGCPQKPSVILPSGRSIPRGGGVGREIKASIHFYLKLIDVTSI